MPNGINEHGLNKTLALLALTSFGHVPDEEQTKKFEKDMTKAKEDTLRPRLKDGFHQLIDMALNDPKNKDVLQFILNEPIDATLSFGACAIVARELVKRAGTLEPTDDDIKKFEEWINAKEGTTVEYIRVGLEGLRALAARNQKLSDHLRREKTDCSQ